MWVRAIAARILLTYSVAVPRSIDWFVFDLGETLIDETRYWRQWATRLNLPDFTWFAILGGVIAQGADHREAFHVVDPSFDLAAAIERYEFDGYFGEGRRWWTAADVYPDAIECLRRLRGMGYRIGIAANNNDRDRTRLADHLVQIGIVADLVSSSAAWSLWKPDVRFFAKLVDETGAAPDRIVYVGDRIDNDVLPARRAGLRAVFLRRGPWAYLHEQERPSDVPMVARLQELPDAVVVENAQ